MTARCTAERGAPGRGSRGDRRDLAAEPRGDGVLMTGTTGFVGMALLARYLERTDRTIFALVRAESDREAAARTRQALRALFGAKHPYAKRVVPLRGDVTAPDLGLQKRRDAVAEQVSEVVHGAASVSFEMGLKQAREINVEGTREMLEFAERADARGGIRRFSYISTAYVAGAHSGCFSEDDLDVGQRFRNAYEQSKFEAECYVTQARERLPVTVMRPSIVVGERSNGWTASFNGLYWPLRAFARGFYTALPARREAPVDIVPVDYVADATFALAQMREAEGATFNLTAGSQTTSVGELIELAAAFFERPAPLLLDPFVYRRVVHPVLSSIVRDARIRRALARSRVFFPYFTASVRYDDRRARAVLHGTSIAQTPLHTYFDRLVAFALASGWGRRQIPRSRAASDLRPEGEVGERARLRSKARLLAAV